ncbi:MAG: CRISPR-associated endonuclease Cas2 [candidate division WOR-3 bacterium]
MDYLVVYDISDSKTRLKVARKLQRYGYRILYSAFYLVDIEKKVIEYLYEEISQMVNLKTDRVFFYPVDPPEVFKGYPLEPWKLFIL